MKITIHLAVLLSLFVLTACSSDEDDWCSQQGGKNTEQGCIMPITEAECAAEGGKLEDPWSCVMPMSKDQCDRMGGELNDEQQCVIK